MASTSVIVMPVISSIRKISHDERGSIAIMFGLFAFVMFAVIGFAVDYTRAVSLETRMSQSLDAAVLAGVKAEESERIAVAEQIFAANMGSLGLQSVALAFTSPAAGEFSGTASALMPTHLAAAVGVTTMPINARSTAAIDDPARVCILVLDTNASQALLVNNGADIEAPDCEVHVHSAGSNAAVFNAGTNLDTKRTCIKGSSILDNGGTHPNMHAPCDPAANPYAGRYPEPASATCDYNDLNFNGGTVNLSPGVYCGWVNFNNQPDVTLAPGTYVIKNGGWNVNGGTWTGNRLTFYFADTSKIQFNSAVAATLTPPTSGDYENVIIAEKEGLAKSPFVLDDSRGFDIKGLVYLPSRDTIVNGGTSVVSRDLTVVVNTLILNQTKWTLETTSSAMAGAAADEAARLIQ